MEKNKIEELIAQGKSGNKRAVSRLITHLERGGETAAAVRSALWQYTGNAVVLGLTGPPGSGKSTLTNTIVQHWRAQGLRVGVLAVDPSSPFTGGAILGDRVRMGDLTLDPNVLIRSMGSRGQLGGLSASCAGAVNAMDACGFDRILIETVGVGQSEISVVHVADLVMVVSVPGLGDDVQTIKAGLMEIGDLFIVNKADRAGADHTFMQLRAMLDMATDALTRDCPLCLVSAAKNTGIDALCRAIDNRYKALQELGVIDKRRQDRLKQELVTLITHRVLEGVVKPMVDGAGFEPLAQQFLTRQQDPYVWAEETLDAWRRAE